MDYGDNDLGYYDRYDAPVPPVDRFGQRSEPDAQQPIRATATRLDRPEEPSS